MGKRISIAAGRFASAFKGSTQREAYCEVTIGGTPHIVDARLVEGHSSRDHMADVPLAAVVAALSGGEFATLRVAQAAADKARATALRGGPRISYTFTPGTLAERYFAENMSGLRAAVTGHDGRVIAATLPRLYDLVDRHGGVVYERDGETRVSIRVEIDAGYKYRQIWAGDTDDLCDPSGVRWTHVKDVYPQ